MTFTNEGWQAGWSIDGGMPIVDEGECRSSRKGGCRSLREGAIQRGRQEPFVKEPFIEGGSCSSRKGAILRERELFFKRGRHSPREGAVLQRRELFGGSHSSRQGGRCLSKQGY